MCTYVHMHTCAGALGGRKRTLNPLGWNLQAVVSCSVWLVGTGELNSGSLQEQQVFLNTQRSLRPLGLENLDAAECILSTTGNGFYITASL